jgi:parvulin-like peptidyl-prolyl isomerase
MILSTLSILLLAAAGSEVPVAHVGDAVVTTGQLVSRVASTRDVGGNTRPQDIIEDLVNEVVMADEGRRVGLAKDPVVVANVEAERKRLAAQLFIQKEVDSAATFDDAKVEELYHLSADSVHLESVIFATIEEAEASLRRLINGTKLADEAKSSLDPLAATNHGDQGIRSRGQLEPTLEKAAFTAPENSFAGPFRLVLGWGVVRVTERKIGDAAGFATQKEGLRHFAEQQARTQYRVHYLQQLRKTEKMQIDEKFLATTGTRIDAAGEEANHVVATAAGKTIRYKDVSAELRRVYNGKEGGHFSGPTVKGELAWALVDAALLQSVAAKKGYAKDPSLTQPLQAFERDEIVRAFATKLRTSVPSPSAAEVQSYFEKHTGEYVLPAHRSCSHVLVPTQERAEVLRQRLVAGESFEGVARSNSADQVSAPKGGALGELTDAQVAAFAAAGEADLSAAFRDTKAGDVSAPVRSHGGWHLVRCGPRAEPSPLPLTAVKDAVITRLNVERGNEAVRKRITDLRARTHIVVDAEAVSRALPAMPAHGS